MKSKHATAGLALTLALGCLLGVGLMFGGAACQQPPAGGDGGPAAGQIGGACLDDGTCTEGFCLATDNVCVACFEEGVACTDTEQCCEDLECIDGECAEAAPPVPCETDEDCDDGLYCNGVETCVEEVCQAGTEPCEEGQTCDEETDTCVAGVVESPYATVEFDHNLHTAAEGLSCTDCHHAEPVNAAGQGCGAEGCHAGEWLGGVPKLKEAQHWTCRPCHDERAGETVRCDTCHTELLDL
jgi:hypothetical protein